MENLCDMAEKLVVEESVTRLEFPVCGNPMAEEDITILSTGLLQSWDIKNEGPPRNFL
ncbi:hypothetical protein QJS10_CPA16g00646 [Acorus calamus]|uniref:Uncharacterized protein n=1 Tax=Acorus calamus TaxID=4465 RepID=A0AAV9D458_ACOCL|nr:hypothetical protein QJS10_CPA16g00646 [Acorus calamus]